MALHRPVQHHPLLDPDRNGGGLPAPRVRLGFDVVRLRQRRREAGDPLKTASTYAYDEAGRVYLPTSPVDREALSAWACGAGGVNRHAIAFRSGPTAPWAWLWTFYADLGGREIPLGTLCRDAWVAGPLADAALDAIDARVILNRIEPVLRDVLPVIQIPKFRSAARTPVVPILPSRSKLRKDFHDLDIGTVDIGEEVRFVRDNVRRMIGHAKTMPRTQYRRCVREIGSYLQTQMRRSPVIEEAAIKLHGELLDGMDDSPSLRDHWRGAVAEYMRAA